MDDCSLAQVVVATGVSMTYSAPLTLQPRSLTSSSDQPELEVSDVVGLAEWVSLDVQVPGQGALAAHHRIW